MEERIIETEHAPEASVHTTTVIRESGRSGGAMGVFMALVLLIAVLGGIYLFNRQTQSEASRNDAIAEAAHDVGQAANKVGDAAQDAANNVSPKE